MENLIIEVISFQQINQIIVGLIGRYSTYRLQLPNYLPTAAIGNPFMESNPSST